MKKQKISITIDENLADTIGEIVEKGKFRNRSHLLEYSLKKLLDSREDLK